MKALENDPSRRYETAVDLAADLRRHREDLGVTAIKPSLGERLLRWSRRRPRLATAVAATGLLVLLLASAIGFKVSIDDHVVGQVMKSVARVETRLARFEDEIAVQRERANQAPNNSAERCLLEERLEELEAVWRFEKDQLGWQLWALIGFTQFNIGW